MSFREISIPQKENKNQATSNPSFAPTASASSWQAALRPLLDQAAALDNADLLNALLSLWYRKCLLETSVVSE